MENEKRTTIENKQERELGRGKEKKNEERDNEHTNRNERADKQ